MTITREQVAALREGDVVEIRDERWPGVVIRGPIRINDPRTSYCIGDVGIAPTHLPEYREPYSADSRSLTVISRAPRPLYVNHDRSEPVPGDVVRDADSDAPQTWQMDKEGLRYYLHRGAGWWSPVEGRVARRDHLPDRLRLLVDGETGQVVP